MEIKVFPALGDGAFLFSPHLVAWTWKHAAEFDLIVVRKLFNPLCSAVAYIARRRGVPYLVVPHGTLSRYTFRYRRTLLKQVYYRLVDQRTLAGAAGIRFTTESERDEAPSWGARTREWVIPHPFKPTNHNKRAPSRNSHQILFLARFHPVKGIDVLLEGFRSVRATMPTACLVLAGSGPAKAERAVRAAIDRFGLEDSVALPGFVEGDAKQRLLAESSIFVLPSEHENFGIAAVEAMDAGLPVVVSRGVAISPIVAKEGAGVVLEQRTPVQLATALLRLLRDPSLRRQMGRRGRKLVRRAFDPDRIGGELLRAYSAAAKHSA